MTRTTRILFALVALIVCGSLHFCRAQREPQWVGTFRNEREEVMFISEDVRLVVRAWPRGVAREYIGEHSSIQNTLCARHLDGEPLPNTLTLAARGLLVSGTGMLIGDDVATRAYDRDAEWSERRLSRIEESSFGGER